jgi:hypothetical protein
LASRRRGSTDSIGLGLAVQKAQKIVVPQTKGQSGEQAQDVHFFQSIPGKKTI